MCISENAFYRQTLSELLTSSIQICLQRLEAWCSDDPLVTSYLVAEYLQTFSLPLSEMGCLAFEERPKALK